MNEIPVYLFTGFMDSGKTSLVKDTLFNQGFADGCKTLIIQCEDGDEEYDLEELKKFNCSLATIDSLEDINDKKFHELHETYKPEMVMIEYNGTWEIGPLLDLDAPDGWTIVQTLTTVDATTFESYMNNMRTMMMEQFFMSDAVIFNRCTDATPKMSFRTQIKAKNRKAQIVYERTDGTIDENDEGILPYDINADFLDISDADYGIFYLDIMDNPKKYVGKTIKYLGQVYNPKGKMRGDVFVPGRFAMTCCADDIQFIGIKAKYEGAKDLEHKSFVYVTATVKYEFAMEYKGKGPVLYVTEISSADKPEEELVYFS